MTANQSFRRLAGLTSLPSLGAGPESGAYPRFRDLAGLGCLPGLSEKSPKASVDTGFAKNFGSRKHGLTIKGKPMTVGAWAGTMRAALAAEFGNDNDTYNEFSVSRVETLLQTFGDGLAVTPAREGSPAAYVSGTREALDKITKIAKAELKADEVGFEEDGTLRLWWDSVVPPEGVPSIAEASAGKTFEQAKGEILSAGKRYGWDVHTQAKNSPKSLKIPYMTSPDGKLRLWFQAQAVHYTEAQNDDPGQHDHGDARTLSYSLDIRKVDADALLRWVCKQFGVSGSPPPKPKAPTAPAPDGAAPVVAKTEASEEDMDIGTVIAGQMGGPGRIKAMLGARLNIIPRGLAIKWPNKTRSKGNYVEITLGDDDLYTVEFFNASGGSKKSVKKFDGVYAEDLVRIFEEQTGWYLKMDSGHPPANLSEAAVWDPGSWGFAREIPPAARAHIKKIKNDEKRRYAQDWADWWMNGGNKPKDADYDCSYLAKQAVRKNLEDLLPETSKEPQHKIPKEEEHMGVTSAMESLLGEDKSAEKTQEAYRKFLRVRTLAEMANTGWWGVSRDGGGQSYGGPVDPLLKEWMVTVAERLADDMDALMVRLAEKNQLRESKAPKE